MAQNSDILKEYVMSINEFVQPKVLKGESAAYIDIIRLFLLEPGTNQTHPEMGIGIRSRYRFSDTSEISTLREEVKEQIETFLPHLVTMDIQIETFGTTLAIFITADDESIYGIKYDTGSGDIGILTLDDLK